MKSRVYDLLKYRSNKKENSKKIFFELKVFIDNISNDIVFNAINKEISNIFKISKDAIDFDTKKFLFLSFGLTKGKFSDKFRIIYIFKDLLNFLFFFIWTIIFSKKLKTINDVKIIFDDIDIANHFKFFKKLSKYFDKSLFLTKKKISQEKQYSFKHICFYNSNLSKKNFIKILNLIFILTIKSYENKINLFFLYKVLIFRIYKYDKIFSENKSEFLITNKFYSTSAIKNYIFKSKGGLLTSCTQKNILEFTISHFIITDILFSLGDNTANYLQDMGCSIKYIVPVGSIVLENQYLSDYSKNKLSKIKNIDILHIGINYAHSYDRSFFDDKHFKNYYRHIYWLKKISQIYPSLKIVIKHHDNYQGDKIENNILKGTGIKIIVNSDNIYGSYGYLDNAKLITSFGSTMILESLSLKKNALFIDPKLQNINFFQSMDNPTEIRVNSFLNFKRSVEKHIFSKNKSQEINHELYCNNSEHTSEKIFNSLNKFRHKLSV